MIKRRAYRILLCAATFFFAVYFFGIHAGGAQGFEIAPSSVEFKKGSDRVVYNLDGARLYNDIVTAYVSRIGKDKPEYAVFFKEDSVVLPREALSYIDRDSIEFTYDMARSELALEADISIGGEKGGRSAHTWRISRRAMIAEVLKGYEAFPEGVSRYPLLMEIMQDYVTPGDASLSGFFREISVSHDKKSVRLTGRLKKKKAAILSAGKGVILPGAKISVKTPGKNQYGREMQSGAENLLANCGFVMEEKEPEYEIILEFDRPFMQQMPVYLQTDVKSFRVQGNYKLMLKGKQIYSGFVSEAGIHISPKAAETTASVNTAKKAARECVKYIVRENYMYE